jgi:hypothetical protein
MFVDEMDMSSQRGKRGLRIFSSPKLEISCALPASIILVVPLKKRPMLGNDSPIPEAENENEEDSEPAAASSEKAEKVPDDDLGGGDDDDSVPYEWIGDTQGEIHEAFKDFIDSLPRNVTSFRICFACSDRMIRDTLTLACRSLSCFDADVGARERLISLPWYSDDGIRHTAKVQSLTGGRIIPIPSPPPPFWLTHDDSRK